MNCIACGALLPEGATSCPQCGQPVPQQGGVQPVQPGGYQQPQQPGGYQQPQQPMGYQQPQQPMGGYQQPQQPMGYQQPQQPMGYQQPQQPMGGYQQPMGGYQQPMGGYQQPMGGYQQPMGGYQQPMGGGFNMNGLINAVKTDWMKLVSLIGALFILLAPFFNWLSMVVKFDGEKEKEHANMFGLAGGDYDEGIFAFFAIVMIIAGIALILFEISDFSAGLANLKAKIPYVQFVEIGIVAVVLLFWFLAFFQSDLHDAIKAGKSMMDFYSGWYDGVKGHVNHGFGPILSMIGILASACVRVLRLVNKRA